MSTGERPYWALFGGLAVTVAVVDQLVKGWVLGSFPVGEPVPIVGDLLRIMFVHNSGALFGMFQEQAYVFAAFSLVVVGLIVWFHARSARNLLLSVALGLLLGGALGNLTDRIRLGYVVDFVDMGIGEWRFYTYNVADASITVSLLLLIGWSFLDELRARARRSG